MTKIHTTSLVSPKAEISEDVEIGPFSVIEDDVIIGKGTKIYNNVSIFKGTRLGENNIIFPGAVIAALPQDLKYSGEYTEVFIGNNNTIRECVTINLATKDSKKTIIGDNCLFMAYSHVAHDCFIGNGCILANSVALGGHVHLEDFVRIGGLVGIHQFVKIGRHCMIGASSYISKDVPPFSLFSGHPLLYGGLNLVGLKRNNFSEETLNLLKKAYNLLYNSGLNTSQAIEKIENELPPTDELIHLVQFIKSSKRGITK